MLVQTVFLIEILSAAFILWLGLYVITRDLPWRHESPRAWQRPALLAGMGLVLLAIYLFGIGMETVSTQPADYIRWQRITWWSIPIAVMLYFGATVLLTQDSEEDSTWRRVILPLSFVAALVLAAGIASGYYLDEQAIEPRPSLFPPYYTPMHTWSILVFYPLTLGWLLGSVVLLLNHFRLAPRGSERRKRLRLLAMGSIFFLIGAIATIAPSVIVPAAPKQIGDILATTGAAILSIGIARYNALEHEQILISDFWHSLSSVAVTVALYLLAYFGLCLLFGYAVQPLVVALLSFLAVLTQTPYNWGDTLIDRLLLPRWAAGYRSRLVLMRQELLTAPDRGRVLQSAEAEFGELVRTARMDELEELIQKEVERLFQYTRFDNPDELAASRLQELQTVHDARESYARQRGVDPDTLTAYQRGESLHLLLECAIDEWICARDAPPDAPECIEQVILRKKYVDGWSRTDVERYLYDEHDAVVTGGAYSRSLKEARARLARSLFDHELTHFSPTS